MSLIRFLTFTQIVTALYWSLIDLQSCQSAKKADWQLDVCVSIYFSMQQ